MTEQKKELIFKLKLKNWWGRESVLIDDSCVLYKFKFDVINELVDSEVIEESDIDDRSKVAHIKITDKKNAKDQTKFDFYQNKELTISFNDIAINRDFIEVKLVSGVHMTIIYKKNIGKEREEILQIIKTIFDQYCENSNKI